LAISLLKDLKKVKKEMESMKKFACYLLAVILVFGMVGCSPSEPQATNDPAPSEATSDPASTEAVGDQAPETLSKDELVKRAIAEGKVVTYGTRPLDRMEPIIKEFNKVYPQITVEHTWLNDSPLRSRLMAEFSSKQTSADIIFAAYSPWFVEFSENGIFGKYVSETVNEYDAKWQGMDNRWLDAWGGVQVIAYNTSIVKKDQVPQKWSDLMDPKWNGEIATISPTTRGGAYWLYYHMNKLYGTEFFDKFGANNPKIFSGFAAVANSIVSGETSIGPVTDFQAITLKKSGAPIDIIYPEEGLFVQTRSMAVLNNAPHPYATRLFCDWLLSKEGAEIDQVNSGYNSTRNDVDPLPESVKLTDIKLMGTLDYADFGAKEDEITKMAEVKMGIQ